MLNKKSCSFAAWMDFRYDTENVFLFLKAPDISVRLIFLNILLMLRFDFGLQSDLWLCGIPVNS